MPCGATLSIDMTTRVIAVGAALALSIGLSVGRLPTPSVPGLAQGQARAAAGRALGYELAGAAIPEAVLADLPAQVQTALGACAGPTPCR